MEMALYVTKLKKNFYSDKKCYKKIWQCKKYIVTLQRK